MARRRTLINVRKHSETFKMLNFRISATLPYLMSKPFEICAFLL